MQVEEGAFIADGDVEEHVEVVIRLLSEEELVEVLEVGDVATRLLVKEELGKESAGKEPLKDELSKSSADNALLCRIRAGRATTKSVPDVASLSQVKTRRTINGSVESVRKRPRIHLTWNAS
jgi:hypothetical protein